jgi:uncharacterized protein involved in exopolysaccharide biosynthesis
LTEAIRDSGYGDAQPTPGLLASLPIMLWQRKWLVIIPAILIAAAAIAAAYLLPRSYRSTATLLVESQTLPDATGGAAGTGESPIDRRMARIRQQILSRPDLVELIQTNNLYDAARRAEPLSVLVDRLRDATTIAAVNADIQRANPGRGSSGSIAFQLAFEYPAAAQAQIVAQTFVDRLLKLDASQTQADAQTNVNYLDDQQSGLQQEISTIESRIKQIAGVNGAALSSAGAIAMPGGIDYSGQIAQLQRENAQLQAQASTAVDRDPNVVAAEQGLTAVQAIYSDNHPDVLIARKRLEIARASANGISSRNISTATRQQIMSNNSAIAQLQRQQGVDQSRAATLAAAQARGPAVAQEVQQLQARADMIRANLARVSTGLLNARSVSKLTDEQRGERLTLIEPPVTPDTPTSPNRPLLIAGGVLGGLAAGLALALLVELIFRPIRNAGQLTALLGEAPLAVVPVLSGKRGWLERWRDRKQRRRTRRSQDPEPA